MRACAHVRVCVLGGKDVVLVRFSLFSRQIRLFSFAMFKVHCAQLQGAGCCAHVMSREEETEHEEICRRSQTAQR